MNMSPKNAMNQMNLNNCLLKKPSMETNGSSSTANRKSSPNKIQNKGQKTSKSLFCNVTLNKGISFKSAIEDLEQKNKTIKEIASLSELTIQSNKKELIEDE